MVIKFCCGPTALQRAERLHNRRFPRPLQRFAHFFQGFLIIIVNVVFDNEIECIPSFYAVFAYNFNYCICKKIALATEKNSPSRMLSAAYRNIFIESSQDFVVIGVQSILDRMQLTEIQAKSNYQKKKSSKVTYRVSYE